MKPAGLVLGLLWAAQGALAASGEPVTFPGPAIELAGRLYRPEGAGRHPAIVMLHGCSGLWARNGDPTASYIFWAEHFRSRGYLTLLVDSFGPRGEKQICTQTTRRITPARERPQDAFAALRWLAERPDVDPAHVHVMGWSNGGSTVLHVLGRPAPAGPRFRSGVAFYPGCANLSRGPYAPAAPLLIEIGAADDWTPAHFCQTLFERAPKGSVELDIYPGAYHAFDRVTGQIRERPDVRNTNRPSGRGATVGPHPPSREKALLRTTAWIEARDRESPVFHVEPR